MPTEIYRDDVRRLLTQGAQLVDVLPAQEYHDLHLPGAISIPLKELNEQSTARLRKDQPVIVYCSDYQ
jgi:rhodanese-related sulfurtransferase